MQPEIFQTHNAQTVSAVTFFFNTLYLSINIKAKIKYFLVTDYIIAFC